MVVVTARTLPRRPTVRGAVVVVLVLARELPLLVKGLGVVTPRARWEVESRAARGGATTSRDGRDSATIISRLSASSPPSRELKSFSRGSTSGSRAGTGL